MAPRESTVWNCAAGSGQASVDLAARFEKTIATDASAQQIAAAAPHPKIECRVAAAEQSGLPDNSIGLVTVAQALHWFDFVRFYAEAARVMAADGVIAVWAYGINNVEGQGVNEAVQNYYSNVVGPYWPPERRLVEDGYCSIPFPFLEFEPPKFLMKARWTLAELLGYFSTWSATNRFIKATGRNPLERLAEELEPLWGNADSARLVTWPLSMRIGRKVS